MGSKSGEFASLHTWCTGWDTSLVCEIDPRCRKMLFSEFIHTGISSTIPPPGGSIQLIIIFYLIPLFTQTWHFLFIGYIHQHPRCLISDKHEHHTRITVQLQSRGTIFENQAAFEMKVVEVACGIIMHLCVFSTHSQRNWVWVCSVYWCHNFFFKWNW